MRQGTNCPPWAADSDEHRAPACFRGAEQAVAAASAVARLRTPLATDLADWHRLMFREVVPVDYYAGSVRQLDSARPCLAQNVAVQDGAGNSVPGAPAPQVIAEINSFAEALRRALSSLELQWGQLAHVDRVRGVATVVGVFVGKFIQIHPFLNGNGRTSRLLWRVLLHRLGIPPQVSVVTRPSAPYSEVMSAAMVGNYGLAVAMILSGLALAKVPAQLPPP